MNAVWRVDRNSGSFLISVLIFEGHGGPIVWNVGFFWSVSFSNTKLSMISLYLETKSVRLPSLGICCLDMSGLKDGWTRIGDGHLYGHGD